MVRITVLPVLQTAHIVISEPESVLVVMLLSPPMVKTILVPANQASL
jgi:hypothetical protein